MHYVQLNEERKGHLGNAEVVFAMSSLPQHLLSQNPSNKSKLGENGQLLFEDLTKELYSYFPTKVINSMSMPTMLKDSLQQNSQMLTPGSFSMINQSKTKLEEGKNCYLPTTIGSKTSVKSSCMQMEWSMEVQD